MIQEMKPYIFKAFEQDSMKEEFGLDTSLTSLSWLQQLNCRTGLNKDLQTPTTAPPPRLSLRRDNASGEWKSSKSLLDQLPSVEDIDEAIKRDHQIDIDLNWGTVMEPKPPHNFATLIYMAIRSTQIAKVTLNDIYTYIQNRYMYYRVANPVWKNSIRHNLTQNKFFKKTMRPDCDDGPTKGGFWTLDINIDNIEDFSRGIWRQSRVRQKHSQGKTSGASKLSGVKISSKSLKSGKVTKGQTKVGKFSPKNRRKSSASSNCSVSSPTISLANLSLQSKTNSRDDTLPSDMMSDNWNLFGECSEDVFSEIVDHAWDGEGPVRFFSVYSGADAEMDSSAHDLETTLATAGEDGGYDSPASEAILDPCPPPRKQEATQDVHVMAPEASNLAHPEDLEQLGTGITPTPDFDNLAENAKTSVEFGIMKDMNLEVIGVGIPLLPRSDLVSPQGLEKIKEETLSQIMNDLDSAPIPLDWEL